MGISLHNSFGCCERKNILKKSIQVENNGVDSNNDNTNVIKNQNEHKREEFEKIQNKININFIDIKNQDNFISNCISFINQLNFDLINISEKLNISMNDNNFENEIKCLKNNNFKKEFENILNEKNEFKNIIEKIKNITIKKIENNYEIIQHNLIMNKNEINTLEFQNDIIFDKLNELQDLNNDLEKYKELYYEIKKKIEKDIQDIQNKIKEYISNIENIHKSIVEGDEKEINNNYITNSMLFDIKDLDKVKNIFESHNFFNDKNIYSNEPTETNNENIILEEKKQELLRKNWNEKCYIFNDYDIHDINYELKAVGLPEGTYFNSASNGFYLDTLIEILEFEIDGKKSEYKYDNYQLKYDIILYNLEENKIHLKYKQSPLYDKLTEGELKLRKIYKSDFYGISPNIKGQKAKFTLINKSDYEIVNFRDLIFIKTKSREYTWAGKVPQEGKRTIVYMSKNQVQFNYEISYRIESTTNKPIKRAKLLVPYSFKGGNNKILNVEYTSSQTKDIKLNKNNKEYEINFKDISQNFGEFFLKGKLINTCKGGWFCDLTDKEIEENTPEDIKKDKEKLI